MIDEIFQMIDWNNESEIQERGIELGKQFADFTIFLQPIRPLYGKSIWENSALIIASKSDEELKPYLYKLLIWLQDLNWPGSLIIQERLKLFKDQDYLKKEVCSHTYDDIWKMWIKELFPNFRFYRKRKGTLIKAKDVKSVSLLIKPLDDFINDSWEECAKVLANKSDEELTPYLTWVLEWLDNVDNEGYNIIFNRMQKFQNQQVLINAINAIKEQKIREIYNNEFEEKRRENWFKNLTNLQKQPIK